MTTIHHLGQNIMAGSAQFPTSYRIRACPKCYGVLYWGGKSQLSVTCDNCSTTVTMLPFMGPLDYARHIIRANPLSSEALLFAVYSLVQVFDHYFRLRKLLLFIFIRGLSHL